MSANRELFFLFKVLERKGLGMHNILAKLLKWTDVE